MSQLQQFRGNRTTIVRPDAYTIRGIYHDTCVAQLHTDPSTGIRTVRLNHGGWRSMMVKERMNQFAAEFCEGDFNVAQIKGEWFVNIRPEQRRIIYHAQTITFTL